MSEEIHPLIIESINPDSIINEESSLEPGSMKDANSQQRKKQMKKATVVSIINPDKGDNLFLVIPHTENLVASSENFHKILQMYQHKSVKK